MNVIAIAAAWAERGPAARSARFRVTIEQSRVDLIADAPGGKNGLCRAHCSLPLDASFDDVEAALDRLFTDLTGIAPKDGISFAETLAE